MALSTLPTLRYLSDTSTTVPSDETWIIKQIEYTATTTVTINSNVYTTYYNAGTFFSTGNIMGPPMILKEGDSLSGGYKIYYWILEIDFNLNTNSIPDLRFTSISSPGSITVPASEQWVVKMCYGHVAGAASSSTFVGSTTMGGDTLILFNVPLLTGAGRAVGKSFISDTLVLNAGDTITYSHTNWSSITSQGLQVGYYLVGTDI
jgi:hypothetical protein